MNKRRKEHQADPSVLKDRFIQAWRESLCRLGVLCLTRRNDSIVMWAHYGSGHTGLLFGFDENHAFFNSEPDDPPDSAP